MPVDLQHLQCVQQMDLHLRSSCLELAPTGECTYCSHLHRKSIKLFHENIYATNLMVSMIHGHGIEGSCIEFSTMETF